MTCLKSHRQLEIKIYRCTSENLRPHPAIWSFFLPLLLALLIPKSIMSPVYNTSYSGAIYLHNSHLLGCRLISAAAGSLSACRRVLLQTPCIQPRLGPWGNLAISPHISLPCLKSAVTNFLHSLITTAVSRWLFLLSSKRIRPSAEGHPLLPPLVCRPSSICTSTPFCLSGRGALLSSML